MLIIGILRDSEVSLSYRVCKPGLRSRCCCPVHVLGNVLIACINLLIDPRFITVIIKVLTLRIFFSSDELSAFQDRRIGRLGKDIIKGLAAVFASCHLDIKHAVEKVSGVIIRRSLSPAVIPVKVKPLILSFPSMVNIYRRRFYLGAYIHGKLLCIIQIKLIIIMIDMQFHRKFPFILSDFFSANLCSCNPEHGWSKVIADFYTKLGISLQGAVVCQSVVGLPVYRIRDFRIVKAALSRFIRCLRNPRTVGREQFRSPALSVSFFNQYSSRIVRVPGLKNIDGNVDGNGSLRVYRILSSLQIQKNFIGCRKARIIRRIQNNILLILDFMNCSRVGTSRVSPGCSRIGPIHFELRGNLLRRCLSFSPHAREIIGSEGIGLKQKFSLFFLCLYQFRMLFIL